MGIWEWDFEKFCKKCNKGTDWKGLNDNEDDGDQTHV